MPSLHRHRLRPFRQEILYLKAFIVPSQYKVPYRSVSLFGYKTFERNRNDPPNRLQQQIYIIRPEQLVQCYLCFEKHMQIIKINQENFPRNSSIWGLFWRGICPDLSPDSQYSISSYKGFIALVKSAWISRILKFYR